MVVLLTVLMMFKYASYWCIQIRKQYATMHQYQSAIRLQWVTGTQIMFMTPDTPIWFLSHDNKQPACQMQLGLRYAKHTVFRTEGSWQSVAMLTGPVRNTVTGKLTCFV